ncbi:MerC domain-containing protein [Thalassoglobus polymorphus]|uniref:MerC mercury resistance protein n=1 Tax=Thalassoglobus polymorphus TaxID=2527994 RepID=A0A517QUS5_9PLAN|nr:MerC domain-containing protein [Thalassoglobus polymorphus]QDT35389.1 MerC mercury resistance protein [Thalassoglobus polymorphus]
MVSKSQRIDFVGADKVAMLFSGCCLVHCLGWPFLIAALPSLVSTESGMLHQALGAFSILISLVVLGVAFDCHGNHRVIAVGIAGMSLLAVNAAMPGEYCSAVNAYIAGNITLTEVSLTNWLTFLLAPLGAGLLIIAHFDNRRLLANSSPRRKKR